MVGKNLGRHKAPVELKNLLAVRWQGSAVLSTVLLLVAPFIPGNYSSEMSSPLKLNHYEAVVTLFFFKQLVQWKCRCLKLSSNMVLSSSSMTDGWSCCNNKLSSYLRVMFDSQDSFHGNLQARGVYLWFLSMTNCYNLKCDWNDPSLTSAVFENNRPLRNVM